MGALRAGQLSLRQQAGQVLLGSFDGPRATRGSVAALRGGRLSGVILFGHNVETARQLRLLTRSLQGAAHGSALISVDQEGGLVRRIPFAAPRPGQPDQGGAQRIRRIARNAGRDLRTLGLNLNLAPVADVPAGRRTALAARAFRGAPRRVGKKVRAAALGYRRQRVAAAVKHFPGLGAAGSNTDDAPVIIRRSAAGLRRTDLVPFRPAIAVDIPVVMASHASYPALDRRRIASQSSRILRRLLRKRMGFGGAVITDALETPAVLRRSSVSVAAERSLVAGCDLLLLSRPSSSRPVFRRLVTRARASLRVRARLKEATARVLDLKRSLGLRLPGRG